MSNAPSPPTAHPPQPFPSYLVYATAVRSDVLALVPVARALGFVLVFIVVLIVLCSIREQQSSLHIRSF